MKNIKSLEKQVEEFYGIREIGAGYIRVPTTFFPDKPLDIKISEYLVENYDKEKEKKIPLEIIKEISKMSGKYFSMSDLEYSKVGKGL